MSPHTPGPWSLSDGWQADPGAIVDTRNVYGAAPAGVVAHVVMASQDGQYTAEKEANARLIAAAPELLTFVEALRAATKIAKVFGPEDVAFWARESEAAIRKATAP